LVNMGITGVLLYPIRLFFDIVTFLLYKKPLAKKIAFLCKDNSTILDFGCDNGSVSKMIMDFNPSLKIVGVDIQGNRPSQIPRRLYQGRKVPYPDKTFDIVLSLDVLHHTKNIPYFVKEMKRLSKRYLIIKDHAVYGPVSRWLVCFSDYMFNMPYRIKCAFNYPTMGEWGGLFHKLKLKKTGKPTNHDFCFGIAKKYNPIFKLEKCE